MFKIKKTISPIWLLSFILLFSATTCVYNPMRYVNQAVQISPHKDVIFVGNDSLNTEVYLRISPKLIRPKRELVVSIYLEYDTVQQFVLKNTTEYHPDMPLKETLKNIPIDVPLKIPLYPGHGKLTYSLKYLNPKNGAYRQAYEPNEWIDSGSSSRHLITRVFADSASYLQQKKTNLHTP